MALRSPPVWFTGTMKRRGDEGGGERALGAWGFNSEEIAKLRESGAVAGNS